MWHFLISTNFTKEIVLNWLLALLDAERSKMNFGSPVRHGPKTREGNPVLNTVDVLGLVL